VSFDQSTSSLRA